MSPGGRSGLIYDIAIIGGGITGAGIARDAALRGLRVALFEMNDFGSGTSSKSSKMVHGGLRYLEQLEFGLVFESVSERRVQRRMAPHLVKPLPFAVPIFRDMKPGFEMINMGVWIYDALALFRAPKVHKSYRGKDARELEPKLNHEGLEGVVMYWDCVTDDSRLVLENIIDARRAGAECFSHTRVLGATRDQYSHITGLTVQDRLTHEESHIRAKVVIAAAGPWSDALLKVLDVDMGRPRLLRPTKGVHLVFPRDKLPLDHAITLLSPVDGRVMFAIPWRGRTVIGTTDTDFKGSPDDVHANADDVRYLCESANSYFPAANFRLEDVTATWAGLRPLIHEDEAQASDVSREHQILAHPDGVIVIAGGKLTTYRLMAREAVERTLDWLDQRREGALMGVSLSTIDTRKRPLPGAEGLGTSRGAVDSLAIELRDTYSVSEQLATHLANVYGVRAHILCAWIKADPALGAVIEPGIPYVWGEIHFAVRRDLARTVDDVLARRVPLLLVGIDQGLDCVERVGDIIAEELGWSADVRAASVEEYRDTVAKSRQFRQQLGLPGEG